MLGRFLAEVIINNGLQGGTYYELYCGGAGAALYLLVNNIVERIVINDADFRIYAFWHSILNHTERFLEEIDGATLTMEEWYRLKQVYENADNENIFDVGFATFYLNRTNRSGILHNSGPIGGLSQTGNYLIDARFNKENLKRRISIIAERRHRIELHNDEAETFIVNLNNLFVQDDQRIFLYLDPPYYNKGKTLYLNNYCHDEHQVLAQLLHNNADINWIVSYDNAPEIIEMYVPFRMTTFDLKYSLQDKRQGSELMIFSNAVQIPRTIRVTKKKVHELTLIENIVANE